MKIIPPKVGDLALLKEIVHIFPYKGPMKFDNSQGSVKPGSIMRVYSVKVEDNPNGDYYGCVWVKVASLDKQYWGRLNDTFEDPSSVADFFPDDETTRLLYGLE